MNVKNVVITMSQACRWEKEKNLETLTGFEPMTLRQHQS